jgi:hypothetical protein
VRQRKAGDDVDEPEAEESGAGTDGDEDEPDLLSDTDASEDAEELIGGDLGARESPPSTSASVSLAAACESGR